MQWLRTFSSADKQSSNPKARCARAVVIQELPDRQGDPVAARVTDTATDEVLHDAVGVREAFDWIAAAALREGRPYYVRATVLDLDSDDWARERGSQRPPVEAARQAAGRASAALLGPAVGGVRMRRHAAQVRYAPGGRASLAILRRILRRGPWTSRGRLFS